MSNPFPDWIGLKIGKPNSQKVVLWLESIRGLVKIPSLQVRKIFNKKTRLILDDSEIKTKSKMTKLPKGILDGLQPMKLDQGQILKKILYFIYSF